MSDKTDAASAGTTEPDASLSAALSARGGVRPEPSVLPESSTEDAPLKLSKYNFSHPRRGRCVIINNKHFNKTLTGQTDRDGTDVDAEACESAFLSLGFDVTRHDDLNQIDMSITMREAAREDHSDSDCFVCVILSHGEEGLVYATNGKVKIDSLIRSFKGHECDSLAGKPKLFFIQACRGRHYDWGTEVTNEDDVDAAVTGGQAVRIPSEADFLMAYSVVPGYFSWRNNVDGSWFIQALVRAIRQYGTELELLQLMTLVNKIVAYDYKSCTDQEFTNNMKQVPCIVSMLTKQVFFKPKE